MTSRTTTAAALIRRASTLSLSAWIFIGLGLGILVGLFFGEPAAVFQPVAEIYVRMMQMSVLPYLVVSLVVGFGQLEPAQARRLALRAGALLLVTWAVTLTVISALPLAFPSVRSASFFSHSLVEPRQPFSIPDLYFTANPFHSLSNAVVPAVVLFSTMVGVALMGIRERERVLAPLRVLNGAITAITMFVIRLTPLGVFAIGAVAAGTMTFLAAAVVGLVRQNSAAPDEQALPTAALIPIGSLLLGLFGVGVPLMVLHRTGVDHLGPLSPEGAIPQP